MRTYTIDTERNMELLSELLAERFHDRNFCENEVMVEVSFLLKQLVEQGLLNECEGGFVLPGWEE